MVVIWLKHVLFSVIISFATTGTVHQVRSPKLWFSYNLVSTPGKGRRKKSMISQ